MPKKILEVKNLSKYFITKSGVNKAVDDVSFDLFEGEIIGLVGQSGSGKSTIGNAIMRTLTEVNGVIMLDGKVVSGKIRKKTKKHFTQNVQMIFQDPHTSLNEKRNVFSAIAEPLKTNKIINKETKEFLSNNKEVKKAFNLSFKTSQLKDELEHLELKEKVFKKALKDVEANLSNYKKMKFNDPENEFSEIIYSYFNPIAEAYRDTFNSLVVSNERLYEIYEKASKDIKTKKLPDDEVALVNSLELIKSLEKDIKVYNNQKKYINKAKKAANDKRKQAFEDTKVLLDGFIKDFRTKVKFHSSIADVEPNKRLHTSEKAKNINSRNAIRSLSFLKTKKLILTTEEILEISKIIYKTDIVTLLDTLYERTDKRLAVIKKENAKSIRAIEKQFEKYDIEGQKLKLEKAKEKLARDQAVFDNELEKFKAKWSQDHKKLQEKVNTVGERVSEKQIESDFASVTQDFKSIITIFLERQKQAIDALVAQNKLNKQERIYKIKETFDKDGKAELKAANKKMTKKEAEAVTRLKGILKSVKETIKENREKLNNFVSEQKLLIKKVVASKVFLGMKRPRTTLYRDTKKILLNRRVFKALSDVGLKAEHAYRYPHEFSGGQKQRIVIARALIMNPKVIVADEPIASLDVSIQAQVINILIRLARRDNISMIFIGHDLSVIEYLADSMLVMHLGKIVEKGLTGPIFGNPVHPYTQLLFDAIPKLATANEPFKATSLKEDYRASYAEDVPSFRKVASKHFVLMNDEQAKTWTKTKKVQRQVAELEKTRVLELKAKKAKANAKKAKIKKTATKNKTVAKKK